jgi:hypothetical protein
VTSPDGANRMFIYTGAAVVNPGATTATTETFTLLLDPVFSAGQFRRGVASLPWQDFIATSNITEVLGATLEVVSVDAGWDDDTGRVEVRIDARIDAALQSTEVAIRRVRLVAPGYSG